MQQSEFDLDPLPGIEPQSSLPEDTDERFSPEAVSKYKEDPQNFSEKQGHPLHHYNQTREKWGGSDAVEELLTRHGINPQNLTVAIVGGFTGEFAQALDDVGSEVIFTDPMTSWVEQAKQSDMEAHRYSAESIPGDVLSKSDAVATFECYYPFSGSPGHVLYNALRYLTLPQGLMFAETKATRKARKQNGADSSSLAVFRALDEHLEIDWGYREHEDLRIYQYVQPDTVSTPAGLYARLLKWIYSQSTPEGSVHIGEDSVADIAEEIGLEPEIVFDSLRVTLAMYRKLLGGLSEFYPSDQLEVGNRTAHLDF
jgi:hypothetical protein